MRTKQKRKCHAISDEIWRINRKQRWRTSRFNERSQRWRIDHWKRHRKWQVDQQSRRHRCKRCNNDQLMWHSQRRICQRRKLTLMSGTYSWTMQVKIYYEAPLQQWIYTLRENLARVCHVLKLKPRRKILLKQQRTSNQARTEITSGYLWSIP